MNFYSYLEIKAISLSKIYFQMPIKFNKIILISLKNLSVISYTNDTAAAVTLEWRHSQSNPIIAVVPAESPICVGMARPDTVFLVLLFPAKIMARTGEFDKIAKYNSMAKFDKIAKYTSATSLMSICLSPLFISSQ